MAGGAKRCPPHPRARSSLARVWRLARGRLRPRFCIRGERSRPVRYRLPCNSGAPAVVACTRGALLLSCTQASVAEFRRQALAPDELTRPCAASGSRSHPSRSRRLDSTPRLVNGRTASDAPRRGRAGQVRHYTSGLRQALERHLGSSEPLRPALRVVLSHPGLAEANVTALTLQIPASAELDLRETAIASLRLCAAHVRCLTETPAVRRSRRRRKGDETPPSPEPRPKARKWRTSA